MLIDEFDMSEFQVPGAPAPEVVQKWIEKAVTRLTVKLHRRGVAIADLESDPGMLPVLKDVVENAVLRVIRPGAGIKSESEGDYRYEVNPLDVSGNIWFPDEDLDLLAPKPAGVGSIQIGLPAHRLPPRRCW